MSLHPFIVNNVAGDLLVELGPPTPLGPSAIKEALAEQLSIPAACQHLLVGGQILEEGDDVQEGAILTLIVDETPLYSWSVTDNSDASMLKVEGSSVIFREDQPRAPDYILVLTKQPVSDGVHLFEFVMHKIGDEQWCGVVSDPSRCGHQVGESIYSAAEGQHKPGWFYYCGRRMVGVLEHVQDDGPLHGDGISALHVGRERRAAKRFAHVVDGDVISLIVDVGQARIAFALNGDVQGGCSVKRGPLYLSTCLDRKGDHVELRKLDLSQASQELLGCLAGELLPESLSDDEACPAKLPSSERPLDPESLED